MMTLDEFLQARLAFERQALAATTEMAPGRWGMAGSSDDRPGIIHLVDVQQVVLATGRGGNGAINHASRWDVRRIDLVLGLVETIMRQHRPSGGMCDPHACVGCGASFQEEWQVLDIEDCPARGALASLWIDHPEYQAKWGQNAAEDA